MTLNVFLILLAAFASVSGLITEAIKTLISDKKNLSYNLLALSVAMIVGCVGSIIYYVFYSIPFNANNIICIILMGFASGLVSMLGYDKVKQTILQITTKNMEIKSEE